MRTNYSPSINIIRDTGREFSYTPTPNGKRVVGQMVDDFKKGVRTFSIIGSYGTGKSSFLLALEQSLKDKKPYFEPNFLSNPKVDFIKVVGSSQSIIDAFASKLNVTAKTNKVDNILSEIYNRYHDLGKKSTLLFIIIDEFGKFLEYAAQNNPETELYFVQQLAEFSNNTDHNIGLITTIHQGFESYAHGLSNTQRQEWVKIKGRFKEIVFNEPVEQLLYLAAERIDGNFGEKPDKKLLTSALKLFLGSKAFSQNEAYSKEISDRIFPLDLFAANALTLSLQRYGQNERSLFSFLEATDFTSLEKFRRASSPFFSLPNVYDYLNFNLYSYLTSQYNPDYSVFANIKRSIEEVERRFDTDIDDYVRIVKSIGLLNIFAAGGSILDKAFITEYATVCLGIKNSETLLKGLEEQQIIFFRKHSKRYILFEGTDLDIPSALLDAANKVSEITDITTLLKKHFDAEPELAKHYSYTTGTPRYFEYVISEEPLDQQPKGEIDGFINLIFNETLSLTAVSEFSKRQEEAVLYGYYTNAKEIKSLLFELEKTNKVIEEHAKDKVAKRELENIKEHHKKLLKNHIKNGLYNNSDVIWFWNGKRLKIENSKQLNRLLSDICTAAYSSAPVFKNELVNRNKISSSIHTAKKNYFRALVNNWTEPDLGFEESKFPAEKTIYITLLKENNISTFVDEVNREISIDRDSSFYPLWEYCNSFLSSAAEGKKNLSLLVEGLKKRPFKLKQGLIELWLPSYLFLKREDFALYGEDGFIPHLTADTLDLITKNPEEYSIKSFAIEGIRLDIFNSYRVFLKQETKDKLSNKTFIETIKPFLTFYRGLSEYTRQTDRLSPNAKAVRNAIAKAQDPEQTFFEDFPAALGTSLSQLQVNKKQFEKYIGDLQDAIRELRTNTDELANRFEKFICNEVVYEPLEFEQYRTRLQQRFKKLKKHLLVPHQTKVVMRIDSMLDDRNAWLNSIAQAVINRSFDNFRDEDEILLFERFKTIVLELDSLTNLSKADIDEQTEEVLGLQFDSFVDGIKRGLVRLPKKKGPAIDQLKDNLKGSLGKDKALNIAALAKLLKELIGQ